MMSPVSRKRLLLYLFVAVAIPVPIGLVVTDALSDASFVLDRVLVPDPEHEYNELLQSEDYQILERCLRNTSCALSAAELAELNELEVRIQELLRLRAGQ